MDIILYILAVLWSIGCVGITLAVIYWLWRDREIGVAIAVLLIGLPLMSIMAILPWALIAKQNSPVLATLHKNEWTCSASHEETRLVMIGKILMPQKHEVCDTYTRSN